MSLRGRHTGTVIGAKGRQTTLQSGRFITLGFRDRMRLTVGASQGHPEVESTNLIRTTYPPSNPLNFGG